MRKDRLYEAVAEAERFLKKAEAVRKADSTWGGQQLVVPGGNETAALTRSSLDLTRALAKLRRSD